MTTPVEPPTTAKSAADSPDPLTQRRSGPRGERRRSLARDSIVARVLPHHPDKFPDPAFRGEVVDISSHGIAIAVWRDDQGQVFHELPDVTIEIERPNGTHERLQTLSVRHITQENGRVVIGFEADDDTTAARLWDLTYDIKPSLRSEQTSAVPSDLARIPGRGHYTEEARVERLDFLREHAKAAMTGVNPAKLKPESLAGNIENLIGTVEIPVGIAGPLLFCGQHCGDIIYAPFATTEGALVASASRGAVALSEAGGVSTRVLQQRMLRAPMFVLADVDAAWHFSQWLRDHIRELSDVVNSVSNHATLVRIEPYQIGNIVHVRFAYETGDAAGQNMTTSCTWKACREILMQITEHHPGIEIVNFTLEGNMSGDKKVSFLSFIGGRGIRVTAECAIPAEVLQDVLKVSPSHLAQSFRQSMSGGIQSGMIGYNINIANVVAAMFTATGQDIACVHESSLGILHVDTNDDHLYASLLMPGLVIGTIGGGTQLPAQRDYLDSMDCAGPEKVNRLAEIICGFALALDLSTMAAIENGSFAAAHDRLGRNRPIRFITEDDLSPTFFEASIRARHGDLGLVVTSVEQTKRKLGLSIISELSSRHVDRLLGLIPYQIHWTSANGTVGSDDVLAKIKPRDDEALLIAQLMATACGEPLASQFERFGNRLPFKNNHVREVELFSRADDLTKKYMPYCYKTLRDDSREAYVIVEEFLESGIVLMNTEANPQAWTHSDILAVIDGIAACHSVWWGRTDKLAEYDWLQPILTADDMVELAPLWNALAIHAAREFPEWFSGSELGELRSAIDTLANWWPAIEQLPQTLIHNDFTLRNLALRELQDGTRRLVTWDWELATIGVPQHDLAEFLVFGVTPDVEPEMIDTYVEAHRQSLERYTGDAIDPDSWREGFCLSVWDIAVHRMGLYLMAHTFRDYSFMHRSIETLRSLLHIGDKPRGMNPS